MNLTIAKISKSHKLSRPNTYKDYVLTHTYEDHSGVFLSCPMTINEIDLLIAYVQFKADELKHAFHTSVDNLSKILIEVFGAKKVENVNKVNCIDLYENWEYWCPMAKEVEGIPLFKDNKKLNDFIARMVEREIE